MHGDCKPVFLLAECPSWNLLLELWVHLGTSNSGALLTLAELSTGTIVGVVVGCVAGMAMLAIIALVVRRKKAAAAAEAKLAQKLVDAPVNV